MFAVIDRFEGGYAVCEKDNKEMVNIARTQIPPDAQTGDVLILGEHIIIDVEETRKRKGQIDELTKDLWE